jgi:predicted negative regulator of RcsB-dependent stress response
MGKGVRYQIAVHQSRIVVSDGGKGSPREYLFDARSQVPLFIAVLDAEQSHSPGGVVDRQLWRHRMFQNVQSRDSLRKKIQRYRHDLLGRRIGGGAGLMQIEIGLGDESGAYRLVVAENAYLSISADLAKTAQAGAQYTNAPWQLLPEHDRSQLYTFAVAMSHAAFEVASGNTIKAHFLLQAALADMSAPMYRSVLLIQLARVALRSGKEREAEEMLRTAIKHIGNSRDADVVLLAQAQYNRAWIAYTRGDFSMLAIAEARKALKAAAPDDQHHGNVATLHGLFLIKDIERNIKHLRDGTLTAKCNEAVAYLSHAIYLLVRAEDFWGAQEACWNLAYGLFQIGNLNIRVSGPTGSLGRSTEEIKRFVALSDLIQKDHDHDGFSVRNRVLLASVHMLRDRDLDKAEVELAQAEKDIKRSDRQASPRELGRLYERRVHYYLERLALEPAKESMLQQQACDALAMAKEHWSSPGLEALLEKELLNRYELRGRRVQRL